MEGPARPLRPLASMLSIALHPFVTIAVLVAVAGTHAGVFRQTFTAVLIVLCGAIVPVAVLMIRQVRTRAWENVDASNREERTVLYIVAVAGTLAMIALLLAFDPRSFMLRGTIGSLAMVIVAAIANRWIKLSLHMAFATLAALLLIFIGAIAGWILAGLLPFLAWSRSYLARHAVPEIVGGMFLGVVTAVAIHFA